MPGFLPKCRDHLETIGETYAEHGYFAVRSGAQMVLAGLACILHGLVPAVFRTTGSRKTRELALIFEHRSILARPAGAGASGAIVSLLAPRSA